MCCLQQFKASFFPELQSLTCLFPTHVFYFPPATFGEPFGGPILKAVYHNTFQKQNLYKKIFFQSYIGNQSFNIVSFKARINNLVKYYSLEIKINNVEAAIKAYVTNFIQNKTHVLRVFQYVIYTYPILTYNCALCLLDRDLKRKIFTILMPWDYEDKKAFFFF